MVSKSSRKLKQEVLLYSDSEQNPDMLYFGKVFVPDPFIAFSCKGKRIAVLSQLEFSRVSKEGIFDEVLSMEDVILEAKKSFRKSFHYPSSAIAWLGKKYAIKSFKVSPDFPCGIAFRLKQLRVGLTVAEGMLLPQREFKNDREAENIRKGNTAATAGFKVVEKIFRKSEVNRGFLYYQGRRLTSEFLQKAIAVACLNHGAVASNSIVAGGDQACDPHCRGNGPLRPDQFIIVDIFPRVSATGYHGDMTRTYLKGRANEEQKKLYHTVFEAEQKAISQHCTGKSAMRIYNDVMQGFRDKGYLTGNENGNPVGFIHGLGHGLGLAVHEPPRINSFGSRLRNGQVITVEPGLYYPGLGAVRVEDVIRVQGKKPEMLSCHGYKWHIR